MAPFQTGTTGGTETGTATDGAGFDLSVLPPWLADFLRDVPPWMVDTVQALVVLLVAYVVSRILVQLLSRRIAQRFRRPSLTRTVLRGVRVGVFLFAFLNILGIYGYSLGDITLTVTVFTAVVGVVLAPIVGSVISGMFLLADQPYEIGDMIELAETQERGFVEDITLRYTKIFTLDNTFLVIPNGTMRERDVVNYSAEDTRIRQSMDLLITYESDVERARDLMEEAARRVDGVVEGGPQIRVGAARYPAGPVCYIENFGDHGVMLRLRYWSEEPYWLLRLSSKIRTNLWDAIADEDVEIAYPHTHQVFDDTSGTMEVSLTDGESDRRRGPHRSHTTGSTGPPDGDSVPRGSPPEDTPSRDQPHRGSPDDDET